MREITFVARGQQLSRAKAPGEGPIVRGTRGYLHAVFHVDEEWEGMHLVASFFDGQGREHAAKVVNMSCEVPAEVLDGKMWKVALVGADGPARLTTNSVAVYQEAM